MISKVISNATKLCLRTQRLALFSESVPVSQEKETVAGFAPLRAYNHIDNDFWNFMENKITN